MEPFVLGWQVTIPRSLSLSKVLFIFTQANTTDASTEMVKGEGRSLEHPLGTILCTFLVH